ncbi:DUF3379 family protein [Aliiglaciecola sp. 3_MG-2023]|uniref:DUF3379 family protein n=1 Tax=Aliiglaciecola sp. 3_MG-2023 TaxID=3062644 RepID=UPI0026E25F92|nr:DUF3379 family protein [Aliiglaciecola sp. 3_MG-2023]MDO6691699.1 DUF3379 family protein [Aliiglaciecola sp. 3_MG-2023]
MDDLTFRRTIYADPNCADEEVIQAAQEDAKKQQFWNDVKQLDESIAKAASIAVPDNLAEKLILKQSTEVVKTQRAKSRIHLAVAASVAFVIGISFSLFQQPQGIDLGEHALAHVTQEGNGYALQVNGDFALDNVNVQLANLGAEFTQKVGRIYYANFCVFDNVRSFHLVLESEDGEKVTVFVVPQTNDMHSEENFSGHHLKGQMFTSHQANVIVVGEHDKSVGKMKEKLQKTLRFSA